MMEEEEVVVVVVVVEVVVELEAQGQREWRQQQRVLGSRQEEEV